MPIQVELLLYQGKHLSDLSILSFSNRSNMKRPDVKFRNKGRSPLGDFLDDRHRYSRLHMRSGEFLLAASKNFAGRKVEMVPTFRLTI